jgi:acetoin utilization deacetylase AcuC-like enzyme
MLNQPTDYLPTIETCLEECIAKRPDLVIYNAGMDPFEGCNTGGLAGITKELLRKREQMVFRSFHGKAIPVAFALAGGYVGYDLTQMELVDLHRLTIEAASGEATMPLAKAGQS